jgi:hypothetical protein
MLLQYLVVTCSDEPVIEVWGDPPPAFLSSTSDWIVPLLGVGLSSAETPPSDDFIMKAWELEMVSLDRPMLPSAGEDLSPAPSAPPIPALNERLSREATDHEGGPFNSVTPFRAAAALASLSSALALLDPRCCLLLATS